MIRYKWLRLIGSTALAVAIMFFSSLCLATGVGAQSAAPATTGSTLSHTAASTFLVAPSFPLGYAPSSVATGDLRRSGKLDLVIADYTSGKITVFLGAGQGGFARGVAYDAGPHPSAVVLADIDGSGKPSVLVSNESEGTISVLLGNGDGTLQPRQSYAVGFNPSFLSTGDFSGNGNVDVAVAGKSRLAIFLNAGKGNLKKPFLYSLSKTPTALTTADFNNDGLADVALANADGTVSILLGNGAGLFRSLPDISVAAGSLSSIVSRDLNKDGKIDLMITQPAQKLVSVLMGNGNGTFAPPVSYPVGSEPISTVVADVNGDGVADLIVLNQGSNTFSVLAGNGDGSFKNSTDYIAGSTPIAAVAGDFYGNGHVDLAIVDYASQSVSLPLGAGDGTFKTARSYSAGQQPISIASGNLNGDKILGLVVANYCGSDISCNTAGSVAVFLADDNAVYRLSSTYDVGAGPVSVALADVNGDKKLDIVAVNRLDNTVSILLGVGDGTFGQAITFVVGGAPVAVAVGDFNKDGKPDLAVLEDCGAATCSQPGSLEILLGAGDGTFRNASVYPAGYSPVALAAGALHPGAAPSLLVANRCGLDASCKSGGTVTPLLGDGSGTFKTAGDIAVGNDLSSIALADLRGLGIADLVVSRSNENTVAVMTGDGNGSFQALASYQVGSAPGALAVADYNGDGIPDVAVANTADSTVSVLFGRGDGTLQGSFAVPVSSNPMGVAAIAGATISAPASLATANGSTSSPLAASSVTVVPNLNPRPLLTGGIVPTISVTWTAGSSSPSNLNQSVSFTATVTGTTGHGAPTGGAVEFFSDGAAISDCGGATGLAVTPGGGLTSTAACTTSVFTASAAGHAITVQYLGANDPVYDNSAFSAAVTQVVGPATPTVSLIPSPASPSTVNTSVMFTAALSGVLTPVTPSGTMTFKLGGTTIAACTQTVQPNGRAACPINTMAVGANTITATYSGDTNFVVAAPGSAGYTIDKASPTLTVTSTPASPAVNGAVTFTATLTGLFTPTAPTGTIAFADNLTPFGTCTTQPISASGANYVATCVLSNLAAGSHSISADYIGNGNFNAATSASLPITIDKASPTLTVASTPASPAVNGAVTLTGMLTGPFTPTAPTGTITFSDNRTPFGTCATQPISASGPNYVATCLLSGLTAGPHSFTADYNGDGNFNLAESAALPVTIGQAATTLSIAAPAAGPVNSNATFTATLHGTFTPVTPTTGSAATSTVAFFADGSGTAISGCSASQLAVNAGVYTATCSTNSLNATAHSISATYSGDTNFANSSTTVSASYTPTKLSGTLATASSVGASTSVGTSVTFTVTYTVSPLIPFAPATTGTPVTFTINGVASPLCPAVALNASQQASCITTGLTAGNDVIGASYAGDNNFNAATAPVINLTVNRAAPTVGLAASSATTPPVVNEPVTFTATVPSPGPGTQTILPGGTVTFRQGATTLCANAGLNTANPPQATCVYSFPSPVAAPGTVTATYSGDSNFSSGTAGTTTGTVNPASTTTVTSSSGTVSVGQSVTFTTVISPQYSGTSIPQGTVTFNSNAAPVPTGTCTTPLTVGPSGNVPSCTFIFTAGGPFNVWEVFTSSDANFTGSTSATVVQTVNKGSFGINLTSTPAPSSVNQPVTFSAVITPSIPTPIPSGTVTYSDNGTTLCAVTVSPTGTIPNCIFTFTSAGSHAILASFPANASYQAASSNTLTQVVNKNQSGTSVSASPASVSVNQQVTFTATLTATSFAGATGTLAAPTGTVGFTSNGTAIAGCTTQAVSGTSPYIATCTTSSLAAGSDPIAATYSGDSNFTVTAPATMTQTVAALAATLGLTASPSSSTSVNVPVTLTAQLAGVALTPVAPSGKVNFTVNGSTIAGCSAVAVDATGKATCTTSSLAAGSDPITATYSGDGNFTVAAPATMTQTVAALAATLGLTASPSSSTSVNVPVTFAAQLAGVSLTPVVPSGKVNFTVNGSTIAGCSAVAVDATGKATCTASGLFVGSDSISATYSGDANFTVAAPATMTQTVSALPATVTVTPSSSNITTTQALSVTVAVSGGSGNPTPTGTVTLSSGSYTSTANALTSGSATINIPAGTLATGADTLTGSYSGDSNYSATTGTSSVTVTIPKFTVGGTAVSVSSGATIGNTSTITVTPSGGFTGSVALTAAITSSPVGAQNLPTLSFGSTSPIGITDTAAKTATLSIFTTAATTAALAHPAQGLRGYAGGTTLAFGLIFGIVMPSLGRRRRRRLGSILFLLILAGGLVACAGGSKGGGGNPGTTPGTYTVTVTGTSGSTTATGTVTLTVR